MVGVRDGRSPLGRACRAVGRCLVTVFSGAEVMGRYVTVMSGFTSVSWDVTDEANLGPHQGSAQRSGAGAFSEPRTIPGPRAAVLIPRPRTAVPPEVRR
jgi:hypothetical protein